MNYIIYGNTSYLDVLQIQTDYMVGRGHLTLFIDANTKDLGELYSRYDNIVFYNNNDQYAKRLLTCLSKIQDEYFLLIHDIDILINVDNSILTKLRDLVVSNGFDRLDLKYSENKISSNSIEIDDLTLVKQDNPQDYIYNVNPSIWKKEALVDLLSSFPYKTYRSIEEMDVQNFSMKYNVFKIHASNHLDCGYFKVLNFFKFLHISHGGKLLPLNNSFTTPYGQSYIDASDEYAKIVYKYNLTESPKWIK